MEIISRLILLGLNYRGKCLEDKQEKYENLTQTIFSNSIELKTLISAITKLIEETRNALISLYNAASLLI